jgi:hypothetical protein
MGNGGFVLFFLEAPVNYPPYYPCNTTSTVEMPAQRSVAMFCSVPSKEALPTNQWNPN